MLYAIFAPNSVAKLFKNTCLKWSWRSCNFTKNYSELFRTIFKFEVPSELFFKKNSHLHWKLVEQLLLLQSNVLLFWKYIFQNSYYRQLLVKLATWSRCLCRLIFARLIFVEFAFFCNSVKICLRRFFSYFFIRRN